MDEDVSGTTFALPSGGALLHYRIARLLGTGGFGVTYLAVDTKLKMQVAIKEYLPADIVFRDLQNLVWPKASGDEKAFQWGLSRFINEAQTLARFRHPNIVRVLSVFEANNTAYMVLDYERGQDLKALLRHPAFRTEVSLKHIVGPLIDGLSEVHRQGYIHRDIKPANLLIRDNGTPVLLDFGSARQTSNVITQDLTSLVTLGYAPAEQYNGLTSDSQGPWTDIYALAAVMHFAITGSAPVDSTIRGSGLLNDRPDPMESLASLRPAGYSTQFLEAIDRALSFKISDRPQTLDEWRSELFKKNHDELDLRQAEAKARTRADLNGNARTPDVMHLKARSASRDSASSVLTSTAKGTPAARPTGINTVFAPRELISTNPVAAAPAPTPANPRSTPRDYNPANIALAHRELASGDTISTANTSTSREVLSSQQTSRSENTVSITHPQASNATIPARAEVLAKATQRPKSAVSDATVLASSSWRFRDESDRTVFKPRSGQLSSKSDRTVLYRKEQRTPPALDRQGMPDQSIDSGCKGSFDKDLSSSLSHAIKESEGLSESVNSFSKRSPSVSENAPATQSSPASPNASLAQDTLEPQNTSVPAHVAVSSEAPSSPNAAVSNRSLARDTGQIRNPPRPVNLTPTVKATSHSNQQSLLPDNIGSAGTKPDEYWDGYENVATDPQIKPVSPPWRQRGRQWLLLVLVCAVIALFVTQFSAIRDIALGFMNKPD